MKLKRFLIDVVLACVVAAMAAHFPLLAQSKSSEPKPFIVQVSDTTSDYQRVLSGPPLTTSMRSGLVVLAASKNVGKHSTEKYEEVVYVIAGTGEMKVTGGETLALRPNTVAYCPPHTEHDIVNTGMQPLRYLYIVAKQAK